MNAPKIEAEKELERLFPELDRRKLQMLEALVDKAVVAELRRLQAYGMNHEITNSIIEDRLTKLNGEKALKDKITNEYLHNWNGAKDEKR